MSSDNKWMVGFRCRAEAGRVVDRFYLVDGAADSAGARRPAARMAELASQCAGRRGGELHVQRVQVQRVILDLLGNVSLSAPMPAEGAVASAGSAMSPSEMAR